MGEAADVRESVERWLAGEGWRVSEQAHDEAQWLLIGEDGAGRHIVVGRARSPADQIKIQASAVVAPAHRAQFAALPEATRNRVLWDLRFRLLAMNVEFDGLGEPLDRIGVRQRIYVDGLQKDAFLQRVSMVKNALITVIWSIVRHLEGVQAPTSPEEGRIN